MIPEAEFTRKQNPYMLSSLVQPSLASGFSKDFFP